MNRWTVKENIYSCLGNKDLVWTDVILSRWLVGTLVPSGEVRLDSEDTVFENLRWRGGGVDGDGCSDGEGVVVLSFSLSLSLSRSSRLRKPAEVVSALRFPR